MPAFCCARKKNIFQSQYQFVLFCLLTFWLLLSFIVLFPGNTLAKIYVWRDSKQGIHLSNRPPPEAFDTQKIRNYPPKEQQQAASSVDNQDVQRVVETVETAFRNNDVDLLMQVYAVPGGTPNEREERVAKDAVAHSLQKFFEAFGVPGKFAAIPEEELPQQFLQDELIPRGCTPSFRGFSFPFSKSNATGLVFLTICGTGQEARLVSFNYDLKDPTPEQQKIFADITSETLKQVAAQLQQQSVSQPKQQPAPPVSNKFSKQPAPVKHGQLGAGKKTPTKSGQPFQGIGALPGMQQHQGSVSLPGGQPPGMDPFAVAQMAGMFTGMTMVIQLAVSLLFYFFTSLCLYLIARKTGTDGAWLAWVPLLQIFPMIQSAGIAWWWGLVLYFAPIPLMFIPLLGVVVMVAWFVALVVFFAIVWMRICERLGMNKWLGLVMFVPLFNVVLMALLAFNSESSGPVVPLKSIVGRTVLAYVLATVVLCTVTYLYVMPLVEGLLLQTARMHNFTMPGVAKQMPAVRPPAQSVPQQKQQATASEKRAHPAKPEALLDAAYYESLFKQKAPDFSDDSFEKGRPQTCVGPACVLLSNFWEQQEPHVWLKVRIPDVPYMTLLDSSTLLLSDVISKNGKNVYDANSSFESEHFLNLRFTKQSGGYLEAIRDVHLLPGTKETDLKSVRGELQFRFPLNVRNTEFVPKDAGQSRTTADLQITLEELNGNSAKIQIVGDIDRYIGVKAFGASGNELEAGGSSSMTSENKKVDSYSFQGDIAVLKVFVAEKILSKSYAFLLEAQ